MFHVGSLVNSVALAVEKRRYAKLYSGLHANLDVESHLREAAAWIARAQDSGTDSGVAYGARFGRPFLPSYPETTGYIIPTVLRLARGLNDASFRERAVRMGDWEIDVQMPCGAVMGGMVTEQPRPRCSTPGGPAGLGGPGVRHGRVPLRRGRPPGRRVADRHRGGGRKLAGGELALRPHRGHGLQRRGGVGTLRAGRRGRRGALAGSGPAQRGLRALQADGQRLVPGLLPQPAGATAAAHHRLHDAGPARARPVQRPRRPGRRGPPHRGRAGGCAGPGRIPPGPVEAGFLRSGHLVLPHGQRSASVVLSRLAACTGEGRYREAAHRSTAT